MTAPEKSLVPRPSPGTPEGRSKGGKRVRLNRLLADMGLSVRALDLKTADSRMKLLEAIAESVAKGRCSSTAAMTLLAVVKEARAEANNELAQVAQAQAVEIDRLRNAHASPR
jgi:hypothetical protein